MKSEPQKIIFEAPVGFFGLIEAKAEAFLGADNVNCPQKAYVKFVQWPQLHVVKHQEVAGTKVPVHQGELIGIPEERLAVFIHQLGNETDSDWRLFKTGTPSVGTDEPVKSVLRSPSVEEIEFALTRYNGFEKFSRNPNLTKVMVLV